jgi:predicted nuclease of predicted toxin-antitoxin system
VRFLIDAQLPRRLAVQLSALGHDAIHTLDLPEGNRTSDQLICARADATDAAVVTKDADFVINRTLHGSPQRLLVIATGNIANPDLIHLIETNRAAGCARERSRASVSVKGCSAKATEGEAGQRPVPPRATSAQRLFSLHS